jgi:hypothetical protein
MLLDLTDDELANLPQRAKDDFTFKKDATHYYFFDIDSGKFKALVPISDVLRICERLKKIT